MRQSTATLSNDPWGYELKHVDTLELPSMAAMSTNVRRKKKNCLTRKVERVLQQLGQIPVPNCLRLRRSSTSTRRATMSTEQSSASPRRSSTSSFSSEAFEEAIKDLPKLTRAPRVPPPTPEPPVSQRTIFRTKVPEVRRVKRSEHVLLRDEFATDAWTEYEPFEDFQSSRRYQYLGQWCPEPSSSSGSSTPKRSKPKDYYDMYGC